MRAMLSLDHAIAEVLGQSETTSISPTLLEWISVRIVAKVAVVKVPLLLMVSLTFTLLPEWLRLRPDGVGVPGPSATGAPSAMNPTLLLD